MRASRSGARRWWPTEKCIWAPGAQVFWVLAAGKELKVISRIRMRDGVFSTPTAANGTLFVMTNKHLYAVGKRD